MRRYRALAGAMLALIPAGVATAQEPGASGARARTAYEDLQMFSQVLNQIRVNHADSVDVHDLFLAAIQGMVRAADPHSYVLVARHDMSEKGRQLREGKIHPVPIQFEYVNGAPLVVSVSPGSEAAGVDIVAGDELLAINGTAVASEDADELAVELAGARGSIVTLKMVRQRVDGSSMEIERQVRRQRIEEASVVIAPFMLDTQTGYLRIASFLGDRVADDVRAAIGKLENQGMKRLVLDLRDNGGGAVVEAAAVAGEFLPSGAIVYTSGGRKAEVTDTGRVKRSFWKRERRYPMVVLVNEGTASAAELLAAAIQDHDRGLLMGSPTFGKSLVMRPFPLADGSVIMLVIGRVRTPCGRLVQRPYRDVTTREYYRAAGEQRDTTGLPSCRTNSGRVVYGGRGIFPDLVRPHRSTRPDWVEKLYEADLPLRWAGGYVTEHRAALPAPAAFEIEPRLPTDPVPEFRAFALSHRVQIPAGDETDTAIRRVITAQVAWAGYGPETYYRMNARRDPDIVAAAASFDRAESLLR